MELKSHAEILKKNGWFILVFSVLVAIAALVMALTRPVQYKSVISFDVDFVNRGEVAEYEYGAYYDLKGAELYTQDLMSWFKTPAFVEDIYQTAEVGYEIDNIARFTNRFKARQYSALNFAVEFSDSYEPNAKKLSNAIAALVVERASTASTVDGQAVFTVSALDPVIAAVEYDPWFVTFIGLIAGGILSLILVYLREYFRD